MLSYAFELKARETGKKESFHFPFSTKTLLSPLFQVTHRVWVFKLSLRPNAAEHQGQGKRRGLRCCFM